jgi:uncharacterized protein YbbK (DUF523 family)
MYAVSACLAGVNCAYGGRSDRVPEIAKLVASGKALPVCPEEGEGYQPLEHQPNSQVVMGTKSLMAKLWLSQKVEWT